MIFTPVQTTLNSNPFYYETIDIKKNRKIKKEIKKKLKKKKAIYFNEIKRSQSYGFNLTLKVNNKEYTCKYIVINDYYLYLFCKSICYKIKLKDIKEFN